MKTRKFIALICILTFNFSCAIRKDLETPSAPPPDKPGVDDGSGSDPTQGTKFCKPDSNGKFDGITMLMQSGQTAADGSAWAEGGGCVLKPIREVWATINNLEVMKFQAADSFTYQRTLHPTPDTTHLYEITYNKSTAIGPIDWTIDWFHGFDKGTFDAPQRVNINYQRVRGTSNIPVWHGGIVLSKVNKSVTSIAIRNDFKARQSSSANEASARAALSEIITHSRDGSPDWGRLNTGLKDNPNQPDPPVTGDPVAESPFCVKDKDGHYPTQAQIATGTEAGVSWVKVRSCLLLQTAAVYKTAQNPLNLLWKNASRGKVSSPNRVSYEKDRHFARAIKWDMTWEYTDSLITFKIDPATLEFPLWAGTISITEIGPGVTAVDIDNQLLTDIVSQSLEQNKIVTLGLLTALGAQ
jgi:hypothetical protein